MEKIFCYAHVGSGNHGCEAIVYSTSKILNRHFTVYSTNAEEDYKYDLEKKVEIVAVEKIRNHSLRYYLYRFIQKTTGNNTFFCKYQYKHMLEDAYGVGMSIGGDNYCYEDYYKQLAYLNNRLNIKGVKTILWGCSIEPNLLNNANVKNDLNQYSLITARESITYEALQEANIIQGTCLFPDPAFVLDIKNLDLPNGFEEGNTIGINISPLIINYESSLGVTYSNYIALIQHIIKHTSLQIALIPHVVNNNNDDRVPLHILFEEFKDTGRVIEIGDCNCMELKGFISRCRMFIGARTHATIAAYSTCVPTLVLGYSVKAKGIAKDIFGTYQNYVIPVQLLENEDDLINGFEWLRENEDSIKQHLNSFMPKYNLKVFEARDEIKKFI